MNNVINVSKLSGASRNGSLKAPVPVAAPAHVANSKTASLLRAKEVRGTAARATVRATATEPQQAGETPSLRKE
jgi:hypothetical protein